MTKSIDEIVKFENRLIVREGISLLVGSVKVEVLKALTESLFRDLGESPEAVRGAVIYAMQILQIQQNLENHLTNDELVKLIIFGLGTIFTTDDRIVAAHQALTKAHNFNG